jgi:hypothetical protein
VVVRLPPLLRNASDKQLQGERFILAHGFRGFSSWLAGPVAFGPVGEVKRHGKSVWWSGGHFKAARKKQKEMGSGLQHPL